MSVRTYNPSVRVGNWNEDIQLEEDKLKDFLTKKERGELMIQKTQSLKSFSNKKEVSISRDGFVHFGDVVMLLNKGAVDRTKHSTCTDPRDDSVLSLNLGSDGSFGVAGSKTTIPCTRNIFVVTSVDPNVPSGERLTFGQPFYLCTVAENGEKMYLHSDNVTFNKASKKARHNEVTLVPEPSYLTEFKCVYIDFRFRLEYEHCPVPSNEKVIISHAKTNEALAVEQKYKLRTSFGWEYEISCHNYKTEIDVNHWLFIMGVPGDTTYPVPPQEP